MGRWWFFAKRFSVYTFISRSKELGAWKDVGKDSSDCGVWHDDHDDRDATIMMTATQ